MSSLDLQTGFGAFTVH